MSKDTPKPAPKELHLVLADLFRIAEDHIAETQMGLPGGMSLEEKLNAALRVSTMSAEEYCGVHNLALPKLEVEEKPLASPFTDQARFMQACGQTTDTRNLEQAAMYFELCEEERTELLQAVLPLSPEQLATLRAVRARAERLKTVIRALGALGPLQRAEMADAIVDSIVVLIGLGLSMGFPMQALWDEVMRSNLAKIDPSTGKVRRREDGKVLKPEGWTPPDIARVLREHHLASLPEEAT